MLVRFRSITIHTCYSIVLATGYRDKKVKVGNSVISVIYSLKLYLRMTFNSKDL